MGAKSVTMRNGRGSRRHNIRDYKETPKHIDPALSKDNEVLVDVPLWKAYNDIFGDAIAEYNEKQKRSDRQYKGGAQAYLKEIMSEKGPMARKAYYETYVQIGDRKDTGLHDCKKERKALLKYVKTFQERNPHLKVIGAYIHADEFTGTLHAHIDWVPVATGYKRGFALQNGLKRALKLQGFEGTNKKDNAYLGWQESERAALREICREHGIETKETKGEHRAWLDKELYIAEQKLQEALKERDELADKVKALESELKRAVSAVVDLRDMDDLAARSRKTITGKVVRSKKDDETLRKAAAHGATFDHQLRKTEEALSSEREKLSKVTSELDKVTSELEEMRLKLGGLQNDVQHIYFQARGFVKKIEELASAGKPIDPIELEKIAKKQEDAMIKKYLEEERKYQKMLERQEREFEREAKRDNRSIQKIR